MKKPRIVFMGTPEFAVVTLRRLVQTGYDILVITQPDKPTGRKQTLTPPPVKVEGIAHNLTILQPVKVRDNVVIEQIAGFKPDVLVTAAFGQLLPQKLLDVPRVGALNVHASLLPRWRGAAPIHRAILAGDKETGVTIMEMVKALDAGPIVGMEKTPILQTDTVGTLHDRLAQIGADLLIHLLPDYLDGKIETKAQPESGVTYAERIVRDDEFVDFSKPVDQVYNHIRGLSPWPGVVCKFGSTFIKIWNAAPFDSEETAQYGAVIGDHSGVLVQCGKGRLQLLTVQPAGKRKMAAEDWVRGLQEMPFRLESAYTE